MYDSVHIFNRAGYSHTQGILEFQTPSYSVCLQVMEKLQEAEKTTKEIEVLRDGYRPAARRGAVLFFVLADLAAINPMYQYSLNSYLGVFDISLRKSLPDSHLQKRLRNIINTLSLNIYHYACTGIITVCTYIRI